MERFFSRQADIRSRQSAIRRLTASGTESRSKALLELLDEGAFVDGSLEDSKMDGADLHDAQLSGARLTGASLIGAQFDGAVLIGANLRNADLFNADLAGANLTGCDLSGAHVASDGSVRLYNRPAEESYESVPPAVASLVRQVGANGEVTPCCHYEREPSLLLGSIVSSESVLGDRLFWMRYGAMPHPCRVFDAWKLAGPAMGFV